MLYPQITGEPNFILIGLAAVFGLLVIIIVYYIVVSKRSNSSSRYSGKRNVNSNSLLQAQDMSNSNSNSNSKYNSAFGLSGAGSVANAGSSGNVSGAPIPKNSSGYYSPAATTNILSSATPSATLSNPNISQVFNIKENIYALDDAPGVCGALGADVASLNQMIDAHKQGADWCNVGWTKDGLAAFPIQYSTWQTLQGNDPANRNMCGQPGINLVRNDPNLLYGVNCYGIKPEPKNGEKVKQVLQNDSQIALNAKIAQFQKNINAIGVAAFNQNAWSE